MTALCSGHKSREYFAKDGCELWERLFRKQGWSFFGDVLNTRRQRNPNHVPKWGYLVLAHFSHFFVHFLGDLLYFFSIHT
jgi:hypothetical protein